MKPPTTSILSEIADSVICIKLQPDSGDIIGRIRELIIRPKYIYAFDIAQQMIFVFDKTGKFVAKLNKRGQGPDEYLHIGPVFIDDNEEYIEIVNYISPKPTVLKYSNINFELMETHPFPDVNFNTCRRHNGFYYFAIQQLDNIVNGKKTIGGIIVYDDRNNGKVLFDKTIDTGHSSFSVNAESFTKNEKNELFVSLMYDNTFYRLEGGEAYPVYAVDFGKYGINNSIGLEPIEKQFSYIKNANDLATFPVLTVNNASIMSFMYYFKQDKEERFYRETDLRQYVKIKNSNKVYHTKRFKNDLTDFPDNVYVGSYFYDCVREAMYENYLVYIVWPEFYFDNDTKKVFVDGIGEITAFDDPIIVMVKLKDHIVSDMGK